MVNIRCTTKTQGLGATIDVLPRLARDDGFVLFKHLNYNRTTMNPDQELNATIDGVTIGDDLLTRALVFEVTLRSSHRQRVNVQQIDPSVTFKFENDERLRAPQTELLTGERVSLANDSRTLKVYLPLPRDQLRRIEDTRETGEVDVTLSLEVVATPSNSDNTGRGTVRVERAIHPGEWSDILDEFGYHDTAAFEMNFAKSSAQVRDHLRTVHAKVNRAERDHDSGDYPDAITNCRRAMESLDSLSEDLEGHVDSRKLNDVDELMGSFISRFLGGLSHSEDRTNITPAMKRDSEFALGITKTCVQYVSTAIEEELDAVESDD